MNTHIDFGAMLTKNQDGSSKDRAYFWSSDRLLIVPHNEDLHGRPIVRLHNSVTGNGSLLLFYPDRIDGFSCGKSRTLVRYDFTTSDSVQQHKRGA